MKVPALRRGNRASRAAARVSRGLNESPRPKAGKFEVSLPVLPYTYIASMKVPALRRGNPARVVVFVGIFPASMKVPALRRGNSPASLIWSTNIPKPQ